MRVATNYDVPGAFDCPGDSLYNITGYDSTPSRMYSVPAALVTQEVRARMSAGSVDGSQLRLRYDRSPTYLDTFFEQAESPKVFPFTSTHPAGFDIGVLRYQSVP